MIVRERRSGAGPVPRLCERYPRRAARSDHRPGRVHVVKMGSAMVKEARRRIQQESLVPASGSTQSGIGLDVTDGRTRLSLHLGLTMLDLIPGVLRTETSSAV